MMDGRCLSKITQGVTTEIMGEGHTPAPYGGRAGEDPVHALEREELRDWGERRKSWRRFGDWLEATVERGVSPNVGSYLGGGTLRSYVKGHDPGPASEEELETMRRVMREAMEDGAFGVSYALIYPPDAFCSTDEIVGVCKVVAGLGGTYITHIRSEADELEAGIEEAIAIGRRAGLPVEVYHLKASGRANWHKMPRIIERINAARDAGLDVTADMYPYTASGTGLSSVLPPWVAAGGKFFENLRDPLVRERIRREVLEPSGGWEAMGSRVGPDGIMPIGFEKPEHGPYVGKRLSQIAEMRKQHWLDAVFDLLIAEEQRIATIYFSMTEENLKLQLPQPWIKISSDAGGVDPSWATKYGPVHPRAYGTFPRVLGRYVREERAIGLEDAVRKMTSAVAARLGLQDRGVLREAAFADVVTFDPATIGDRASFEDSHQLSVGVRDVWVNGTRVVRDGSHTGAMPGMIVKGPGAR
jgi:N-acyl-D-aspartate/D-glutamate deacylase